MRSSIDGQSDESETSSVCSERSERSFDSFKRPCDVSMIHYSECVYSLKMMSHELMHVCALVSFRRC